MSKSQRLDESRGIGFIKDNFVASNNESVFRRAQTGDAAAFEKLYKAKCSAIYNLCLRMTGSATVAADLTYQVFLDAFGKIQSFESCLEITSYLRHAAFKLIVRKRHSQRRETDTSTADLRTTR